MIKAVNLARAAAAEREALIEIATRVIDSGWYILGPETETFEKKLAAYLSPVDPLTAIGVNSGLDAIRGALFSVGIGQYSAVMTQANTYTATPMAIAAQGALPVFCDVDPHTWLMTAETIDRALASKRFKDIVSYGGRSFDAIIPVHLYGSISPMPEILSVASAERLIVVEDAAQCFGAMVDGKLAGTWGTAGAFSFFPSKNLGALGDAGAIVTTREEVDSRARAWRNQGQFKRYVHDVIGGTSRLDSLQAAFLAHKIELVDSLNARRQVIADAYRAAFADIEEITIPTVPHDSVYHLFPIATRQRDALRIRLASYEIEALVHYPLPCHLQKAYQSLGYQPGDFPVCEQISETTLSLPIDPYLTQPEVDEVITRVREYFTA